MSWARLQELKLAEAESEERKLKVERVDLFSRNTPGSVVALNLLFSSILAALLWPRLDHALLVGWVVVIVVVAFINHWRHHSYRNARAKGTADPDRWTGYFSYGPLANGLAWGVGGAMLYVPDAPLSSMFVLLVICGVAAGSVASQASLPRALYGYLFTALPIPAARIALFDFEHGVVAFLLMVYLVFLVFVARSNHATITESIRLRLRNERLLTALRESETHFRALVENSADWVLLLRPDSRLAFQSPSGERLLGYGPAELDDIRAEELVHPDDRELLRTQLQRIAEDGEVVGGEARWRHRDGRWVLLHTVGRRLGGQEQRVLVTARDVTERRAFEAELRQAKDVAEAANRVKDQFLANMSHEMRSPLHAIQGMTDLIGETTLDERQRHYVGALKDAGQHLRALVDDVLDYARAQADTLHLDKVAFDLRDWVASTANLLAPEAKARDLQFEWFVDETLARRHLGDPRRLRQVLVNLVTNALKFTERGTVRIAVTANGTGVRLSVSDTGCGIPEDKLDFIFQPFTQVDGSRTRAVGGAGLGLAISRRLVEAMGGTLACDSRLGEGSRFTADLPLPVAPHEDPGAPAGIVTTILPTAHVLVVDDAEMNRYLIREFFRGTDCELDMATNGREAVEACARCRYDLVLMDMQMPDLDGWEATRAIRKAESSEGCPPVPIVALTAGALAHEREAAIDAGCTDFLSKPVSRAELLSLVAKRLGVTAPGRPKSAYSEA